jgi:hypothetical protein
MQAAAVHHSRLADALNAVGNILGGNKTLRLMKNPDGSVDVKQVDSTPGEKWGRVAQAALSGAAKGFAVGQGPGGAQRAAAAGIMSGMAMPQQQADQTMQQAATANDQNRAQQLFKANMALLNQKSMANTFAMQQAGIQAGEHEDDRQAQIQKSMTAVNATKAHVGNMNDVAAIYNSNKDWQQAHHDGRTVVYTSYGSDGKVNGADVYMVPEDQMAKPYDQPYVRKKLMLDPTDPTKKPIWAELGTIPANAMSVKDRMAMLQSDDNDTTSVNAQWQAAQIAGQKATSEIGLQGAQAQEARAKAAEASANQGATNRGTWQLDEDAQGNPILFNNKTAETRTAPAGLAKAGTADKQQAVMEKQFGSSRDSMNFANDYLKRGIYTGPDDTALQLKFFDLAKPATGFRLTTTEQKRLDDSRDMINSVKANVKHALSPNAPWFSDTQRQQIVGTMNDLARAKGLNIDANGVASLPTRRTQATPAPTPTPTLTPTPTPNPQAAAVQAPAGATMVYHDPQGNVTGWAVGGKYVAR